MPMKKSRQSLQSILFVFVSTAFIFLSLCNSVSVSSSVLPSDGAALLAFKSEADVNNNLHFSITTTVPLHGFCHWQGVTCHQNKAVRFVLQGLDLGGIFAPNTLTRLDQLRILSLRNNSLTGSIPDLSLLVNLKALLLDHNDFTGSFPPSILFLHKLRILDFCHNKITGPIPYWLVNLEQLSYLRLDSNRFNGTLPALNQTALQTFNISINNLSGSIPVTLTLLRFGPSSFLWNPGLCGGIIQRECKLTQPFFGATTVEVEARPPVAALGESAEVKGVDQFVGSSGKTHKRTAVIVGFSSGVFLLVGSVLCFVMAVRKQSNNDKISTAKMESDKTSSPQSTAEVKVEQKMNELDVVNVNKSGKLVFCAGEAQLYTLDQLMRASAEFLGRGRVGTTYKAMLDNREIVTVKRLDACKMAGTSKESFERHMESLAGLGHPNLVPLRAYFHANEERFVVYDYQPNGSIFSLVHGTKSTKSKPLHWTSCLKIAEDVAQGLAYIHQAWKLVHGNLKPSNVLLGADFEARITDYCFAGHIISDFPSDDESNSSACRAPEARICNNRLTSKSDVYTFGILLFELLTGKLPSEHPFLAPYDMVDWVVSCRKDDRGGEERRLENLVEVAIACRVTSPEQRPTMRQVLKMLQEIKETVLMEYNEMETQIRIP